MFPQAAQVNYFFIELRLALIAVQKSLYIYCWDENEVIMSLSFLILCQSLRLVKS